MIGLKAETPWDIGDTEADKAKVKQLFAAILGSDVDPNDVAFTPSTAYAMSLAASNLESRLLPGKGEVLILEDQMHSNVLPWQHITTRRGKGSRLVIVQRPRDADWTTALLSKIQASTAIVAVPPCHWACGGLIDLVQVGKACRAVGAALVVDGTQYVGASPLDVTSVQPDLIACSVHKWCLCPYGASILYVSKEHHQTWEPLEQHDRNRLGADLVDCAPMDSELQVGYPTAFMSGARRFDMGGRPQYTLLPMMVCGLDLVLKLGVKNIAVTCEALTDRIAKGATELGFVIPPKRLRSAHIIGLKSAPGMPSEEALVGYLKQQPRPILVSERMGYIRVSPYIYNSVEEVDYFLSALARAIATLPVASRL